MKTMRGFADPITLGFVLAAIIGAAGANTAAKVDAKEQQLAQQAPVATASVKMSDEARVRPVAPAVEKAQ
ncbi:MAG: hypothetical protein KJ914_10270 [Gammaproteobacteria bacterium]|nr:hypothetical protein [Gammaproteobacteria bacterium]MBU1724426.1 hypothetical protein [Gammaproteobacteria bacterium]MBU2004355.1 hypothetical protein [Gammaproteobacteria bacterium]